MLASTLAGRAEGQGTVRVDSLEPLNWPAARSVDRSQLARSGLRRLEGKYVTIVTDLPSTPEVDELPDIVDKGVPQLATYFGIEPARLREWRVLGMVMRDSDRFAAAGLLPAGEPEFPDGLSRGFEFWVHEQPSDYYRRHLVLHELTHSFMATLLGGCGPGWYMEGTAELLGTHTWDTASGKLLLGAMPANRDAAVMWGRVKLVRNAVDGGRGLPIAGVLEIDNRRVLPTTSYAWCWALAKFLDAHPRYQERFRAMGGRVLDRRFNETLRKTYASDWSDLDTEWRLFVATLEYGHDLTREAIDFRSGVPGGATPRATIEANRGWQSTGWYVDANQRYEIRAGGRYVVGAEEDGTPWVSEPGGVTLEYHGGRPLGQLLAVVDDHSSTSTIPGSAGTSAFLRPMSISSRGTFTPTRSGTVYLRVNDSPASLGDNRGNLTASLRAIP